ncbi:MAG TPA: hypothetical protein VGN42_25595, partial [Pirellulales bacterium]|nr:hypothetical protein [Pirellulales bacterium]
MSLQIFTCEPCWETPLIDELGRVFPASACRPLAPGWIELRMREEQPGETPCLAFAAQCLPDAESMSAPSVSKWGQQAGAWLIEALPRHAGPWRLHVFAVQGPEASVGQARCRLIEAAIVELLRKKQRRWLRTRVTEH